MRTFKFYNTIVGWGIFLIAAIVYLLTIEPTASFWDCSEFITTAYRLEVGHPPGAPLFMIMGRLFTMLAPSTASIPVMVNIMSALASAFTILFLFWSITHLARKIIASEENETMTEIIVIIGAGVVGALAYTFSDTFWFSAVEGEVYGTSSLFTALVFWCILKWENEADEPFANRWLILISYLIGLSIGVHLLNLLAIPAIVFVYYFRKYDTTRNGILIASALSAVILAMMIWVVIPGLVVAASWFELLFVNGIGLPYNSGVIIYAIVLTAGVSYGIVYTFRNKKTVLNTILLCLSVIIIGYSSYAMTVIRSTANPPMDQNNPDNVFSLLSYLNRDQYGSRPLGYGHYYNAPLDSKDPYLQGAPTYIKKNGKYVIAEYKQIPNYDDRFCTIFPRMYSSTPDHVQEYKIWASVKGTPVQSTNRQGEPETLMKPTFGENLQFFFTYQVGFMYLRYFMWNFSGRQNDVQSQGGILSGNWITGINFLDSIRLGDQNHLPPTLGENKAKNAYFMLPFILGLLGMFFQYNSGKKGKQDFSVVMLLFFMTGLAIVVYLNQDPLQPRERDYAYAGSFYAFAIWIGLGVLGVYDILKRFSPARISAIAATVISLFAVPMLMASQNWDDHDRSGRYTARDFGGNYLKTCAPNAIIFTNGDNDTFPLWYAQEVEGIRTDVRVCNLSYLQTDWYIDQMRKKYYDSDPLPIKFTEDQVVQGTRDIVYVLDQLKRPVNLNEALDFIRSEDPGSKLSQADNASFLPSKQLYYPVDKSAVLATGTVAAKDDSLIVDKLDINLTGNYLSKDEMIILDIINNNKWKRPIYFAVTVGREKYLNLQEYFQAEGFAYRLVPIKTKVKDSQIGRVESKLMYDNIINKFKWGNMNAPKVYLDENNMRMSMNIRNNFVRLADQLVLEGRTDSAVAVLDRCNELVPNKKVPYNYFNLLMAEAYYKAAQYDMHKKGKERTSMEVNTLPASVKKGNEVVRQMVDNNEREILYYLSLEPKFRDSVTDDLQRAFYLLQELGSITEQFGEKELSIEINAKLGRMISKVQPERLNSSPK
ncbi:MAG: DUF2723 domain-containing protein [Prolixibacteraceae bacterium]